LNSTDPQTATRGQIALAAVTLAALWFVLCRHLSSEWSVNEQYSYGWFVPFFAAFLFWLRWEDRPTEPGRAEAPSSKLQAPMEKRRTGALFLSILAFVILFPVRLFEVANPDWRPLDWIHTAAVATLTLLVIWTAGGWPWVKHFAFPVCFFFVAVPWISPIEEPIVQGLMRAVAAAASETITLFGIPAQLEGNLIRVQTGLVGVNEACSGVRSLQTSLMIGLLFGELKRLSLAKRCLLVLGALAIALLANFARAFFLVWVAATQSISAVDRWHDFAGYTIVGIVFLGSLGLTALLGRRCREVGSRKYEVGNTDPGKRAKEPRLLLSTSYFLLSLAWLLAIELGVEGWYRAHESGLVARERWSARWPETAKDFHDIHLDEKTRRILRFDEGRGATWKIPDLRPPTSDFRAPTSEESALLYFFRWRAGSNSALLANVHRPDVCLPASGWIQAGDYGIRSYPVSPKFSLPFRHFVFSQGPANGRQRFAHAFYCLREDRVRNESEATPAPEEFAQQASEWSRSERVSLVIQGRRHLGQQVMEFVVLSPREIAPDQAEAGFAKMVPELVEQKSEVGSRKSETEKDDR
jgi:exosortase